MQTLSLDKKFAQPSHPCIKEIFHIAITIDNYYQHGIKDFAHESRGRKLIFSIQKFPVILYTCIYMYMYLRGWVHKVSKSSTPRDLRSNMLARLVRWISGTVDFNISFLYPDSV